MACEEKGKCGGCFYVCEDYKNELKIKKDYVINTLHNFLNETEIEDIIPSPLEYEYKNKMEFSFGNNIKDGPLILGMHQKKSFYNICRASNCELVKEDVRKVVELTEKYFGNLNLSFRHRKTGVGFLRHLVVRRSYKNNNLLINLVTTSILDLDKQNKNYEQKYFGDYSYIINPWVDEIKKLDINIAGICHTVNDALSDTVDYDDNNIHVLYGKNYIIENLLNLDFKISLPSFFQTNTYGAEKLYNKIREYLGNEDLNYLYDLYCGTGTISQVLSKNAKKVIGVEIVGDAIRMANENAKINNIDNIDFLSSDVLDFCLNNKFDEEKSAIILDPPRSGVNSKALDIITDTNIKNIIYISCKCESLNRDMAILSSKGYKIKKLCCVDMFPKTNNVETVVKLEK